MRKVILSAALSLDGKIEGPNGEFDWCFDDQDYGMTDFLKRIDSIVFGRKSYELVQKMDESGEFKDPWGDYDNYVFSKTLTTVKDGYTLVSEDPLTFMNTLKAESGKDIWLFGGASLTRAFIEQGLLDELFLGIHPIILGPGKPMFEDLKQRMPLELMESKVYNTGMISVSFKVLKEDHK